MREAVILEPEQCRIVAELLDQLRGVASPTPRLAFATRSALAAMEGVAAALYAVADGEIADTIIVPHPPFDNAQAMAEGWLLGERDDGFFAIQKDDDRGTLVFESDFAALVYVKQQAAAGSEYHATAVALHGTEV